MIRVGRIDYANCAPIFHELDTCCSTGNLTFTVGVPAYLNSLLATGQIDVCPSSSIEYAFHQDDYLILPDLSISSLGPVASVLLFSRVPIEQLDGADIILSDESATSINLLKILLHRKYGFTNRFTVSGRDISGLSAEQPAMLLIGDKALKGALNPLGLHVYDLGTLWNEWTGKPFVFALWFCRREAAERNPEGMRSLAEALVAAKEAARCNLESIADLSADSSWMGRERLLAYWRDNISYDLSDEHLAGLSAFYRNLAGMGLIGEEPRLHFLDTVLAEQAG